VRNALFDEPAAKIRIKEACFGPINRLAKPLVVNVLTTREPRELLGFEDL
jgi:hypothetical protein